MDYSRSTILITGGASGIGLALAKRFLDLGATVVVCGRREAQLELARRELPGLHTLRSDVSREDERLSLFQRVTQEFPGLNVLINNAGIQNRPPPLVEVQDWSQYRAEIATNLEAPMHLSLLFATHLRTAKEAAIMNVTSGLAFSPLSFMSCYCATKAALHSFSLSLRHQLRDTCISVVEIVPPKVNTDLGGKGLHDDGAPLDEYADATFHGILEGRVEVGFGFSERSRRASREELDELFRRLNP